MASFFQPGSNDPAIAECPPQTFEIYCNSLLSTAQRLESWHQLVTLIVGCVAVAVPLTIVIFNLLWGWCAPVSNKLKRYVRLLLELFMIEKTSLY